MGFTAAELAEMARADAEIEATFRLTNEDLALGRQIDREAVLEGMDARARKRAEYQRRYYETHKDEQAERMRRYYETHKDEQAERMRRYYETHKDEWAEYMRRYRRRKRMEAEGNVNDLQD